MQVIAARAVPDSCFKLLHCIQASTDGQARTSRPLLTGLLDVICSHLLMARTGEGLKQTQDSMYQLWGDTCANLTAAPVYILQARAT